VWLRRLFFKKLSARVFFFFSIGRTAALQHTIDIKKKASTNGAIIGDKKKPR
jgi:hypothetical protein